MAPELSASKTYSSTSKVVSITTLAGSGPSATIRRAASRPSIRGIRTSMSTTSGRDLVTSLTAAIPSSASPTTSMSG